ncbi:MAG: SEC-C metal-binding domain-containing protein [Acidimicrobiia bacterium]
MVRAGVEFRKRNPGRKEDRPVKGRRLTTRPIHRIWRYLRCPCRSGLKYKHCHGLADR